MALRYVLTWLSETAERIAVKGSVNEVLISLNLVAASAKSNSKTRAPLVASTLPSAWRAIHNARRVVHQAPALQKFHHLGVDVQWLHECA